MSTILERIQYGFDRDSRRTWRRRSLATGQDYHYGYDGLSQVVSSDRGNLNMNCSAIAAVPVQAESWDYDPTGNWHGYKVEANGAVTLDQARVHDKGNRLMQIKGEEDSVQIDRVGRITLAPDESGYWNQPLRFKWDAWNRITEVQPQTEVPAWNYKYDGLNRRITQIVDVDFTETYFSNTWKPLEVRYSGQLWIQYFWGARHRDDLVRRDTEFTDGVAGNTRYVLMDYFSPAAIADENGEVTERYDFSAFGVRRIMTPEFGPRDQSECGWSFAFQGQFLDQESGLLNYGFRYYAPHLGRWMCKDPLGVSAGPNLYVYCENAALQRVDFLGLDAGARGRDASEIMTDTPPGKPGDDRFDPLYPSWGAGYIDDPVPEWANCYAYGTCGHTRNLPDRNPDFTNIDCPTLMARIKTDGGSAPDENGCCPKDHHRIHVRLDPTPGNPDFHVLREEADGTWGQIVGYGGQVHLNNVDANGVTVTDPRKANHDYSNKIDPTTGKKSGYNYTEDCGDWCVKNR